MLFPGTEEVDGAVSPPYIWHLWLRDIGVFVRGFRRLDFKRLAQMVSQLSQGVIKVGIAVEGVEAVAVGAIGGMWPGAPGGDGCDLVGIVEVCQFQRVRFGFEIESSIVSNGIMPVHIMRPSRRLVFQGAVLFGLGPEKTFI